MNELFRFELIHTCAQTGARLGRLHTPHGVINTPCYMPVGTQATVKAMTPRDLADTGSEICLANRVMSLLRRPAACMHLCAGTSLYLPIRAVFRCSALPLLTG